MEAVDRFDIVLDVSDREILYDYVECKEYTRPKNGTWDMSTFKGKGSLDCLQEDDENGQLRVDLLDKAISDKRILEKHSKSEETKEKKESSKYGSEEDNLFEAFDNDNNEGTGLPQRVIPFFNAGEVVKGKIELTLNQPVNCEKLVIGFQGRALVQIRIYHPRGFADIQKRETVIREKVPLWEQVKGKTDDVSDSFALLDENSSVSSGCKLYAGNHVYNVEFTIPAEARQSAPPMVISTHNKGYVMYRLKAAIAKGKALARGNIVTHKGIWVKRSVDIAQDPQNLEPISIEEKLNTGVVTFWKSGSITVRVTLPKSGYLIGEQVPINIEMYNQSKGIVEKVSAYIRMYGKARLAEHRGAATDSINFKSVKVQEGPVPSGASMVYNWTIPWNFLESSADGNLFPVGDLNDCKYLDINYEVHIKVHRSKLHRNMDIGIPIVVGNVNSMDKYVAT